MDSKKGSIFFSLKKYLFCQINWNEQKTNVQHHKRNIIMTIILYLTKKFSWILSLQPFGIFFRFVLFFVSLSRGSHKTAHRLTKFHLFHIHISNSGIQKKMLTYIVIESIWSFSFYRDYHWKKNQTISFSLFLLGSVLNESKFW